MRCPKCNTNTYSHHQEISKSGTVVKRYYACRKCKYVFETIEQIIENVEANKVSNKGKSTSKDISNKEDKNMMLNFKIYYDDGDDYGISKVYAIDTVRDRFLIVNAHGNFLWVDTKDCTIKEG